MNVRTLCLAILYFEEATGYEIKKLSMEGKYSHFVDASFGSIYPALSKLEKDGLVECREESQPGKPPRKIYSITDRGREEFLESLLDPPARDVFRSEFLMIAMCADILPKAVVRRAIETRRKQLEAELEHLNSIQKEGSPKNGTSWAVNYGLTCIQSSLTHLNQHASELEDLAETGPNHDVRQAAE